MSSQYSRYPAQSRETFGWLSACLRWPSLLFFGFVDIALVITIISLTIISSKKNGFVTTPSRSTGNGSDGINAPWDLGVLWTSFPSFIFALFGAYWAWMAGALAERQPYVELRKEQGAGASLSILLDYRVVASIWRWWGAFRKSHFTVGATTLLSVLLTYAIAPLAARLFVAQAVMVAEDIPIAYNTSFQEDQINSTIDWRPVFDTVSANLLYGGHSVDWADQDQAFRPFSADLASDSGRVLAANTTAYSAYLNCQLQADYIMRTNGDGVTVTGRDRGCDFQQTFGVNESQATYFKTTVELGCSSSAYYSRFVFTAASYSASAPNRLDNISVISCATGYRQANGTLTISSSSGRPVIESFTETGDPNRERLGLWRVFEQGILQPTTFNPQVKWSTSNMGSVILYYAQRLNPTSMLDSEILMEAIPRVFTTVYLNVIAMHGFGFLSEPELSTGVAYIPTTRLFVVPWVAYTVLAFLAVTLFSVIFLFFHLEKSPSILTEEPHGLLSMADMLNDSELLNIAANIRGDIGDHGGIRENGKLRREVMDKRWTAVKSTSGGGWVITSGEKNEA
ncbi:hypothetical protein B0I35DRAFT_362860 [Stachybotrys elegans]|uniref:Uncharacterized protein n=1 Tax=Stachybotrys elegans TaxID=80388 RepID=A0A8K0SFW2_9HYPO|nr:hypothetical protein B0I35DRAFT_362860 [Stachybotrys elegans]